MQTFEHHLSCRGTQAGRTVWLHTESFGFVEKALNAIHEAQHGRCRFDIGQFEMTTHIEPLDDLFEICGWVVLAENHLNGLPDQIARDCIGALQFSFIFQLYFSSDRWQCRVNVRNTRDNMILARDNRPALRIADHIFQARNRQTLANARAFVDSLIRTSLEGDRFNHLLDERRHIDRSSRIAMNPSFLLSYGNTMI